VTDDKGTPSQDLSGFVSAVNDSILIRDLPEGATVKLRNGSTAEVVGNPRDGGWLIVRIVDSPSDASKVGAEEMVFCTDVMGAR
jgi:hypothetical protein